GSASSRPRNAQVAPGHARRAQRPDRNAAGHGPALPGREPVTFGARLRHGTQSLQEPAAMTIFAASIDETLERELPAASSGCQHAYGRIVLACQNTVTAIALAITGDRQASEDIAQEAFVKGWQQLHQLRSASSFLPWLRQITRNLARDWLRAQRGRPLSGEAAEVALTMAADPTPGVADRLQRLEEEIAAEDIISALPADSREVLLLYYREGQHSQQVAD